VQPALFATFFQVRHLDDTIGASGETGPNGERRGTVAYDLAQCAPCVLQYPLQQLGTALGTAIQKFECHTRIFQQIQPFCCADTATGSGARAYGISKS
jgi:hypothetical protein